jgi:hypothetical protein
MNVREKRAMNAREKRAMNLREKRETIEIIPEYESLDDFSTTSFNFLSNNKLITIFFGPEAKTYRNLYYTFPSLSLMAFSVLFELFSRL